MQKPKRLGNYNTMKRVAVQVFFQLEESRRPQVFFRNKEVLQVTLNDNGSYTISFKDGDQQVVNGKVNLMFPDLPVINR